MGEGGLESAGNPSDAHGETERRKDGQPPRSPSKTSPHPSVSTFPFSNVLIQQQTQRLCSKVVSSISFRLEQCIQHAF